MREYVDTNISNKYLDDYESIRNEIVSRIDLFHIKELDHTLARKNDSPTWCGVIVVVWCYCGNVFVVV